MIWWTEFFFCSFPHFCGCAYQSAPQGLLSIVIVVLKLDNDCRSSTSIFTRGSHSRIWYEAYEISDILQTERTYICSDTGSLLDEPQKRFEEYQGWVEICIIYCHWSLITAELGVDGGLTNFKPVHSVNPSNQSCNLSIAGRRSYFLWARYLI